MQRPQCGGCTETTVTSTSPKLDEVEAIEIHYLRPRRHEVAHERLLRVVTCVDFCERPEFARVLPRSGRETLAQALARLDAEPPTFPRPVPFDDGSTLRRGREAQR